MKDRQTRNPAASVRQRLQNLSQQTGEPFHLLLVRYALERLLFRLSQSPHRDQFTLKGSALFALWTGRMHRPTRDVDLLGSGKPDTLALQEIFHALARVADPDDGLTFQPETVVVTAIREQQEYGGQRVTLLAKLGNARIPLQIDVGYGDVVTPAAQFIELPTLLSMPAASLRAYPKETVVAEKFHAMVVLGMANSRMKDFFDLWILSRTFPFAGTILRRAIQATFRRRKTELPTDVPLALTDAFADDAGKQTQWKAFVARADLSTQVVPLRDVLAELRAFLLSPLQAAAKPGDFRSSWPPSGPWQPAT